MAEFVGEVLDHVLQSECRLIPQIHHASDYRCYMNSKGKALILAIVLFQLQVYFALFIEK